MNLKVLPLALLGLLLCYTAAHAQPDADAHAAAGSFFAKHARGEGASKHTNNWAVLVCSSRYWFNYRHMANALGMYRTVKRLGIPDSNIILMLADDAACNARNKFPGTVYHSASKSLDLYGDNIEVDYRGYEVTVENFLRVLTGRVPGYLPRSKRLLSDDRSNVFVYLTGHGGSEFLKFQDNEELSAFDVADAVEQMAQKGRYNELLLMVDTCQANTMYRRIYSPNVLATGSAEEGENSYSYENDADIGVAVIDSFTHMVLEFMEGMNKTSDKTMADLFGQYSHDKIHSTAGHRADLFKRPLDQTLITDFFGAVSRVEVNEDAPLESPEALASESPDDATNQTDALVLEALVEDPARVQLEAPQAGSWWARQAKVWAGLGLVGALVGWVAST